MLAGVPAHTVWRYRRNQRGHEKPSSGRLDPGADNAKCNFTPQPDLLLLGELNHSLEILAALFPDVRAEVFREMLLNFSEESRLELVIDQLIKHKAKWVRGRWRIQKQKEDVSASKDRAGQGKIPKNEGISEVDRFRTESYKLAVKDTLLQEFKRLSSSTIDAVLAECNHSYLEARPILLALSSKSWKRSLLARFLMKSKPPTLTEHPLILWQATPSGSLAPSLRSTANDELDEELYTALIAPIQLKLIQEQITQDNSIARELNDRQAEDDDALFECGVCFTSITFERLTVCNDAGHYICYECVQLTVKEALYGQGWAQSIDAPRSTLKCIAPTSAKEENCTGCVSRELVRQALCTARDGRDLWRKLQERIATESIMQARTPVARCPFCCYAEATDGLTVNLSMPRFIGVVLTMASALGLVLVTCGIVRFHLIVTMLLVNLTTSLLCSRAWAWYFFSFASIKSGNHHSIHPSMEKFDCLNPECRRTTCLTCKQDWQDIHRCYDSEKLALRTHVESAMADAVKRTCPKCNLSFVKSEACNKMTCICGYQMCYVCRKEITRREGYTHFCQHFRINPGDSCSECNRCDLYRTEDDGILIEKAKERAEREWRDREGFDGGWQWDENLPDL